jgi:multiple sugar transport system permease protein
MSFGHLTGTLNSYTSTSRRAERIAQILRQLGWAGFFLAPNFIIVLLFTFIPMLSGMAISLYEWDVFSEPNYIALENYTELFEDEDFWISMKNTAVYTLISVPISLVGSLILAVVLNRQLPGTLLFRTVFFIPVIMSGILVSLTWQWLFNADYGPINYWLSFIGIRGPRWLNDPNWSMVAVIIVTIWKNLGFNMVIFLAALQDVPRDLYDAASIDGANGWQGFRFVTLPMISAATFFSLIVTIINSFQVFDIVYSMTEGGPGTSTLMVVMYIYKNAFEYFRMGYASAIATVFFVIILAFTMLQWYFRSRWVHGEI